MNIRANITLSDEICDLGSLEGGTYPRIDPREDELYPLRTGGLHEDM